MRRASSSHLPRCLSRAARACVQMGANDVVIARAFVPTQPITPLEPQAPDRNERCAVCSSRYGFFAIRPSAPVKYEHKLQAFLTKSYLDIYIPSLACYHLRTINVFTGRPLENHVLISAVYDARALAFG